MSLPLRMRLPDRNAGKAPGAGGGSFSAASSNFRASTTPSSDFTRGFSSLATASARAKRQQQAHSRVVQNSRLPLCVLLDAVRAVRRVDGHRNGARQQNGGVTNEKLARSGQHQRHAPSRGNASPRQFFGAPLCGGVELAKRQRVVMFAVLVVLGDQQVRAVGVVNSAVADDIDKRFCFFDDGILGFPLQDLHRRGGTQCGGLFLFAHSRARSRQDGPDKFLGRARFCRKRVRKPHVEGVLPVA